jgi:Domain of unknown function (DUF4157)
MSRVAARVEPASRSLAAQPLLRAALHGPSSPLDAGARRFFETRLDVDLGGVRVHTDAAAARSAHAVDARAYAVGRDLVFAPGQYAPATGAGRRLLAHELAHVAQQRGAPAPAGDVPIGAPHDGLEAEAEAVADAVARDATPRTASLAPAASVQRDLATPAPAVAAPARPELTDAQVQAAIAFNRARYDAANTRLIQDLLGGPVTGRWTEDNIRAIAETQEEYGLQKDGKVGHELFVFLNREQRLEKSPTSDAKCLVAFRLIGPDPQVLRRIDATHCDIGGHFATQAEFSSRCRCGDFEYRQFIRGHFTRTRGGVVTDIGNWFSRLPAGRLNAAFQEDGDNTDAVALNYGHRDQGAEANPENHYIDATDADDQAAGCRYRSTDQVGGVRGDCLPGDEYDIDVNFRGEIQRNGRVLQSKRWTAIRDPRWRP